MEDFPQQSPVVLFDGVCKVCSNTVQAILKYDRSKQFCFASLQSEDGTRLRDHYRIPPEIDSVIVVQGGKAYWYAEAIFVLAERLGGVFRIILVGRILPLSWSNRIYRWIAKNRFRWFGRRSTCFLPDEQDRLRFL